MNMKQQKLETRLQAKRGDERCKTSSTNILRVYEKHDWLTDRLTNILLYKWLISTHVDIEVHVQTLQRHELKSVKQNSFMPGRRLS